MLIATHKRKQIGEGKTDLLDELAERVTLKEGGRTVRMSKQRALVKALVVKGIKGDDRAIGKALDLLLRLVGSDEATADLSTLSDEDQAILDALIQRRGGDDAAS